MSYVSAFVERKDEVRLRSGAAPSGACVWIGDILINFVDLDHVESVAKAMLAAVEAERAKAEVRS